MVGDGNDKLTGFVNILRLWAILGLDALVDVAGAGIGCGVRVALDHAGGKRATMPVVARYWVRV